MDWLAQTQAVPTWAIIFVGVVGAGSLLVLIFQWIGSSSGPDRTTLGISAEKEEEEAEEKQEEGFTVIAKFRDGSEARWRNIESWGWSYDGGVATLERNDETIAIFPYANLLWIADEKFEFERMGAPKPLNG